MTLIINILYTFYKYFKIIKWGEVHIALVLHKQILTNLSNKINIFNRNYLIKDNKPGEIKPNFNNN
jgi:hypothetical protein